ncbi:hemagglutinin repeat-containing protein [Pseudoduganella plicata]|uniref:Peptidase C39 domain-containing protein n=1 Tax=Pseudoduganella plicata TaxID=321984 RepID=A0ABX5SBQ2_9BURK|nr:hemagglutinin repeat-containing protein [Pseudoduganella plicata]QBQ36694.1 hypothetical protein E1742_11350 [Pseudoduganella plicata]
MIDTAARPRRSAHASAGSGANGGVPGSASGSGTRSNANVSGAFGAIAAAADLTARNGAEASGSISGSGGASKLGTAAQAASSGAVNGAAANGAMGGSGEVNGGALLGAVNSTDNRTALGDVRTAAGNAAGQNASAVRGAAIGNVMKVSPGGLFIRNPDAGGSYLYEARPQFANQGQWTSSDYLLNQLAMDPAVTQKRLGDGFYEQRLVREQLSELTGRQPANGASDDTVYKELLTNAVSAAREFGLRPGIALSADQVARLTSDIVWMESQTVQLPDGSTETVLVPKVYVAHVDGKALRPGGALVTGENVSIKTTEGIANFGGVIDGGNGRTMLVAERNIVNQGGTIAGGDVQLDAGGDIRNETLVVKQTYDFGPNSGSYTSLSNVASITATGKLDIFAGRDLSDLAGKITAGSASIMTGRDVTFNTVQTGSTYQSQISGFTQNDSAINHQVSQLSTGGNLTVQAFGNLNLTGTQVSIGTSGTGTGLLEASGAINIAAVTDEVKTSLFNDPKSKQYDRQVHQNQTVVGAGVASAGDLKINAGEGGKADLNITGSAIGSGGTLKLIATNSVNIAAVQENDVSDTASKRSSSSTFKSKTTTEADYVASSQSIGSSISGANVDILADKDINVIGSAVAGDGDVALYAGEAVNIVAGTSTLTEQHHKEVKESGFLSGGGFGFSYGTRTTTTDQTRDATTQSGQSRSVVGSLAGNLNITAGEAIKVSGSDLAAGVDMTLDGRSVTIDPGLDDSKGKFEQKTVQDGLTLSLGGSVINAIQTAQSMASAGSQSKDGRVQALAAATTALAARNAASDIAKNGLNVSISLTAGHSENQYTQTTSNVVNTGSVLTAGNDITIRATGGGKDSNINVVGSEINAQGNVKLQADNEVNLVAAQDREAQHSDTKSMSAAAGIGASIGTNGMSIGFTANASLGRGKEDGEGTTQLNSHVNAGKQLEIVSGADTNIKGAVATGQKVVMNVGGDLNIESLQDTAKFDSKNQSVSVGGTAGVGVSVNGSFSNSSLHSDYASVQEQSGIRAGSDGFQITVKGNTDLKGAVVTSTQEAIEQHKNTLSTGSLTVSDIENHADYKGQSVGLSGGYGTKGDKGGKGSEPDTTGVAGGIWKPMQTGGTGMNTPIAMAASDSASSTTLSGISGADITITDEQKQQELTGKTGEEALAGLNRDVSSEKDSSGALKPIFDKAAIEAAFAVTNAFGQQANALLQEYAQEADEKLAKAKQLEAEAQAPGLTDAQREERANQAEGLRNEAAELAGDWGPKGTYRQVTTALIAAASGNVTGSAAQFGQTLLVNYAQQQGAAYLGSLVEKGELTEGTPLHAAVHAMLACAGAAASSQQCTSGAAGAAASSLLTQLFADPTPDESKADAEAKRNLIASLVAGLATATNLDASAATSASVAATDNNWLATQQVVQMNKELTAAKGTLEYLKVLGKWGVVSMNQTALTKSGFVKGLAEAGMSDLQGMVDFFKDPVARVKGLKAIVTSEEVRGQVADDFLNELTTKLNAVETALRVGGETNAEALGKNVAELIWQVGGLVSGVGDVAKAAVTLAKVGVKVTKGALATLGKAAVEGKLIPGVGSKIATAPSVPKLEPVTYTPATVPKDNPGVPKSIDVTPESGGLKPTDTLATVKSVENPTLSEVPATPKDGAVHEPGNGTEAYNPEPSDGLSADTGSAPNDVLADGAAGGLESPRIIPYDPPGASLNQGRGPLCGPTCAAMVVTDKTGRTVDIAEVAAAFENGVRTTGVNYIELSEVISKYGIKNKPEAIFFPGELNRALDAGNNVILNMGNHFIIVDGKKVVDGVTYYMTRDPSKGPRGCLVSLWMRTWREG